MQSGRKTKRKRDRGRREKETDIHIGKVSLHLKKNNDLILCIFLSVVNLKSISFNINT